MLDDNSRGAPRRLPRWRSDIEFVPGDIRDAAAVLPRCATSTRCITSPTSTAPEFFYSEPELVLDVGVRGMVNVIDACRAHGVGDLVLASSSEVYQTPPQVPSRENVPLVVPDRQPPLFLRRRQDHQRADGDQLRPQAFERVLIFRPHNVYGPDMGFEHVIPQFALRLKRPAPHTRGPVPFPIQGRRPADPRLRHVDDSSRASW